MAYRVAGAERDRALHRIYHQDPSAPQRVIEKRRNVYYEEHIVESVEYEDNYQDDYPVHRATKRRRESFTSYYESETTSLHLQQPAPSRLPDFLILKETPNPLYTPTPPLPPPPPLNHHPAAGTGMERTTSGMSISDSLHPSTTTTGCAWTELLSDSAAAARVRDHLTTFSRRFPDSKHERVLRSIISPKPARGHDYPLDKEALGSIFAAANEIFFNGRLSQRVAWDWSHASSSAQYQLDSGGVIGTTALRLARKSSRGFETLIVLSSPILREGRYSRRLLISTFLHELVHSYLFICCGFRARECGGHTPGFRVIAGLIDEWAGRESCLHLTEVEADLDCFRDEREGVVEGDGFYQAGTGRGSIYPCSGVMEDQRDHDRSVRQQREQEQYHHSQSRRGLDSRVLEADYHFVEEQHRGVEDHQYYRQGDQGGEWPETQVESYTPPHHLQQYDYPYQNDNKEPRHGIPYR